MDNKLSTIKKVYHDLVSGVGSILNTYRDAKSFDKSITQQDVKDYVNKLPQKQMLFQYKGYNSFVANKFLEQIQLDIGDFTKKAKLNNGYRYALVGIDVFTRYGWAVKMKTKKPHDVIAAFKEIINTIGIPESIFSDMEGNLLSTKFIKLLNENNLQQRTTLNHAPYAEVFIRT